MPLRKSEPINKKLTESLFGKSGSGVGPWPDVSGGGGAASVGKSELKSTVAVGWMGGMGVGDGVVVGKNGSSVGTWMLYSDVGVTCSTSGGWNGVGVGEAFGAAVINTNGNDAGVDAGAVPHEASNNVSNKINLRVDDVIKSVIQAVVRK